MTIKTRRHPIEATEGTHKYYLVPLANSDLKAKVDIADYHRVATAFTPQWIFNTKAVRVPHYRKGSLRAARLIMNPPEGYRVHIKNGDALDLRSANLELRPFVRRKLPPQAA
ncbi:hypothetical protein [Pseudochelatococcus sp. G4_1912]|uniref:hypothetical protein n=1 Tax=Pseudochelatococcus sp. G4_1912 TaxID=3114288 RepID=UPI0039C70D53